MKLPFDFTPKELSIICDALWTTAGNYSRDSQQYMRDAAVQYEALAKKINGFKESEASCEHQEFGYSMRPVCRRCGTTMNFKPEVG